jgi:hypothetical protein
MFKKSFGIAALVGATLVPAMAQKQTFTIQANGNFTKNTTTSAGNHTAEQSAGLLLSYDRFFKGNSAIELNYGVTRSRQEFKSTFVTGAGIFGGYSRVNAHEFTAAYKYRWDRGKYKPFVLGGAGAIAFDQILAGATTPTKLAIVYGAGVDMDFSERVFFRAMYRGQVYRIPGLAHLFGPNVQGFTHNMQPTVGAGFRF